MNNTSCERLMWIVLSAPAFKYIRSQKPDWNMRVYRKRVKQIYHDMINRTPDIGTLKENALRICLSGGAVWLAAYEAADGRMDEKLFADMVVKTMEAPILQASFKAKRKIAFTREGQEKRKANADKSNSLDCACNWNAEIIFGRDADEYTMVYHKCGLCGLGRQEGLFHLVKYMCVLDYMSVELMGGTLFRKQTLAQGGECCDFYVCRKGSEWEKEREAKDAQMQ